jgi:hypothetical protein
MTECEFVLLLIQQHSELDDYLIFEQILKNAFLTSY